MTDRTLDPSVVGAQLRRELDAWAAGAPNVEASVRRRVLAAFRAKSRGSRRWVVLAAALTLGGLLTLFVMAQRAPRVAGEPIVQAREWVSLPEGGYSLGFTDGSTLLLDDRAHASVVGASQHGATIALLRGHLDARVVHRARTDWQVLAGPFTVRVTGTRFIVDWKPESGDIDVVVVEGRVLVSQRDGAEHSVEAGAHLQLRTEPQAQSPQPPLSAAPVAQVTPEELPEEPTPVATAVNREATLRPKATPDWRALSSAGRYGESFAAAEQQGFERLCAELPAAELLTLASTARLAGHGDRARAALTTLRSRFAGSNEAAVAAFTLGRQAEASGASAQASEWFRTYLRERPGGALACDAQGRLLEEEHRTGLEVEARRRAETYLKQCPGGAHSALARLVAEAP